MEELSLTIAEDNPLYIQFEDCENRQFLRDLAEYFTEYADNYQYSPKYQAGVWDGRICVFNIGKRQLPYGLLIDFLRFKKEYYPELKLNIEPELKKYFKNDSEINFNWDLKWPPRPYQEDSIKKAIERPKSTIRIATAGGKCTFDIELIVEIPKNIYNKYFSDYGVIEK